jgi:DNA-binding MarR family transcriptional regulator
MTDDRPLLTTRMLGETENALRALLTQTLRGTGLDYQRRVVLSVVARNPSSISAAKPATRLVESLKIDAAAAVALIDDLRGRHILDESGDPIALTADGTALFQRLDAEIGELTRTLWAGLDADDLAAAYRVHSTITDRANQLLARRG